MPTEAIIVLVVILVLFGGSQIPKLAKNLGKAQSEFKTGLTEGQAEADAEKRTDQQRRDTNTSPSPAPPSTVDPATRETPPPD